MQCESQRYSRSISHKHEKKVLTRDVSSGLVPVEAHYLERRDLPYTLGYVDVVEVEEHDERQCRSACHDQDDDVVHPLHRVREAQARVDRCRPSADAVIARDIVCIVVRRYVCIFPEHDEELLGLVSLSRRFRVGRGCHHDIVVSVVGEDLAYLEVHRSLIISHQELDGISHFEVILLGHLGRYRYLAVRRPRHQFIRLVIMETEDAVHVRVV